MPLAGVWEAGYHPAAAEVRGSFYGYCDCDEDLPGECPGPRAGLVRRRCRGQDPRPPGHPDRERAAGQAQADLHPARRCRRLRDRRQRREGRRDRRQAGEEALLAPQRLPRRDPLPHPRRSAREAARGGHPQGGQGNAPPQPARPPATSQAQGLRGAGASPPGPEAGETGDGYARARRRRSRGATRLMIEDEEQQQPEEGTPEEQPEEGTPEEQQASEQQAPEEHPPAEGGSPERGEDEGEPAEVALSEDAAAEDDTPAEEQAANDQPAAQESTPPKQQAGKKEDVVPGAELDPI